MRTIAGSEGSAGGWVRMTAGFSYLFPPAGDLVLGYGMRKTFPLVVPGKESQRVLELVRGEVGKYMNREKRKKLAEGYESWDLACRVGPDEATAVPVAAKEVHAAIGQVAAEGAEVVYVEILASARPRAKAPEQDEPGVD
jgi:hypothetical protein